MKRIPTENGWIFSLLLRSAWKNDFKWFGMSSNWKWMCICTSEWALCLPSSFVVSISINIWMCKRIKCVTFVSCASKSMLMHFAWGMFFFKCLELNLKIHFFLWRWFKSVMIFLLTLRNFRWIIAPSLFECFVYRNNNENCKLTPDWQSQQMCPRSILVDSGHFSGNNKQSTKIYVWTNDFNITPLKSGARFFFTRFNGNPIS